MNKNSKEMRRLNIIGTHYVSVTIVFLLIGVLIGSVSSLRATELQKRNTMYVPDREFPELIKYVWDGWDLKHGMGQPKEYSALIHPGATVHVFVRNKSNQSIKVKRVLLNGIDITRHIVPRHREHRGIRAASYLLNDTATTPEKIRKQLEKLGAPVWYQVRPNPVPPDSFAEVIVRLRKLPDVENLLVAVGENKQKLVNAQISTDTPAVLTIASVNFNNKINQVYLYVRNSDSEEFEVRTVQVDGKIIELAQEKALRSVHGFLPIEIPLAEAWEYGSFHHIAVTTADGLTAATVVRARDAFFALGMWGYRNSGKTSEESARDTISTLDNHLFNTHMAMGHTDYLVSAEGLRMLAKIGFRRMVRGPSDLTVGHPQLYARFLLDEPDAHEYAIKKLPGNRRIGGYAQGLIERQQRWTKIDSRTLSLLNVDLTYKPENWLTYGQLADIMAVDPYYQMRLKDVYWKHPGWLAQFCHPYYVYAVSEIVRWASEPHPLHVILNSVSFRGGGFSPHLVKNDHPSFRYGTPEEKRIEFYYALAAGAKGISYWWFTPYGKCRGCGSSEPEAKEMMQEMARLNAEARTVKHLLATASPAAICGSKVDPFISCRPPWLMVRTLFTGTDTAIAILVNRDHASDRVGTIYQPIAKAEVKFQKPYWMDVTSVIRLSKGNIESVQFTSKDDYITVNLENIELTDMLIFTERQNLLTELQKLWKRIRPRLNAVTKDNF